MSFNERHEFPAHTANAKGRLEGFCSRCLLWLCSHSKHTVGSRTTQRMSGNHRLENVNDSNWDVRLRKINRCSHITCWASIDYLYTSWMLNQVIKWIFNLHDDWQHVEEKFKRGCSIKSHGETDGTAWFQSFNMFIFKSKELVLKRTTLPVTHKHKNSWKLEIRNNNKHKTQIHPRLHQILSQSTNRFPLNQSSLWSWSIDHFSRCNGPGIVPV